MINECVICVINHKQDLQQYEQLSLLRIIDFCYTNNILHNLCLVLPNNMDINMFWSKYINPFLIDKHIDNSISYLLLDHIAFSSLNAYNNMLSLSINFYGHFCGKYKYMLTYQLDGYIFDNQLEYFLNKQYDYIGGYYLPMYVNMMKYNEYENIDSEHHLVMNSGVSLKKISFCIDSIKENYTNCINGIEFNNVHSYINDDDFFSMFYNTEVSAVDSIKFSLNYSAAETHYAINNFQYPFCCHAFHKSKFLQKLIDNYNKEHNLDYSKYIK